jgi:hypothetical protein
MTRVPRRLDAPGSGPHTRIRQQSAIPAFPGVASMGVQDQPHLSTAVVSTALARSAGSQEVRQIGHHDRGSGDDHIGSGRAGTRSLLAAEDIGQKSGGIGAYSVDAKLT